MLSLKVLITVRCVQPKFPNLNIATLNIVTFDNINAMR
jgi:hypothetical protein